MALKFPATAGEGIVPSRWHNLGVASDPKSERLTALAIAARDGDRRALESFVQLAQGDVWRLCAYLASPKEADDLAQETFERAIGSLHRFHGRSGARPWLFTICRRVCVDSTRRSIRRRRIDDAAVARAAVGATSAGLGSTVELDLAIEQLAPERQSAFLLTQVVGLSYAEAAVVLDVAIGTIRSRVARARLTLVAALDDSGSASPGNDRHHGTA